MAKLYFRHGAMDSAKTMNLLAVAHNYRKQGKRVVLLKPRLDDRFGRGRIASRSGLEADADMLVDATTVFELDAFRGVDCVLVDEAQFMAPAIIDQLRVMSLVLDMPIICYGLRTDFRTQSFPGARRLMELADSIEEVKVTCQYCGRKAVFNLRMAGGNAVVEGEQIVLGDAQYAPVCGRHYVERVGYDGLRRLGMTMPAGVD
jgi:thymidine kinase